MFESGEGNAGGDGNDEGGFVLEGVPELLEHITHLVGLGGEEEGVAVGGEVCQAVGGVAVGLLAKFLGGSGNGIIAPDLSALECAAAQGSVTRADPIFPHPMTPKFMGG